MGNNHNKKKEIKEKRQKEELYNDIIEFENNNLNIIYKSELVDDSYAWRQ